MTLKRYLETHQGVVGWFIMGYMIFAGCVVFPLWSEPFPMDFTKAYLVLTSYGVIALALAGIHGPKKEKIVYGKTLGFTVVGLVCRYLMEFGEVSNTYNFTLMNLVLYLALVPLYTVGIYHYLVKLLVKSR